MTGLVSYATVYYKFTRSTTSLALLKSGGT